jgi:hypothetical protein
VSTSSRARQAAGFGIFILIGGVLYALLSPGFGFNQTTYALIGGTTVALLVMSLLFSFPANFAIHRQVGEWGALNVLPGSLLIGAAGVALSRLLNFQPGYLYGVLAGYAFQRPLSKALEGRVTAYTCVSGLAIGVLAWIARVPVSTAAAKPGASVLVLGLEAFLVALFLLGFESLVVGLLPLRFLPGQKVISWSRAAWVTLFVMALFAVIQVLLTPGNGYAGHLHGGIFITTALYVAFAGVSIGLWLYFRTREGVGEGGADGEFELSE